MPRAKSAPAPKKRASGPSQPEDRRLRKQAKFRLLTRTDRAIDARATELGIDRSSYIERLVDEDVARAKRVTHQSSEEP